MDLSWLMDRRAFVGFLSSLVNKRNSDAVYFRRGNKSVIFTWQLYSYMFLVFTKKNYVDSNFNYMRRINKASFACLCNFTGTLLSTFQTKGSHTQKKL